MTHSLITLNNPRSPASEAYRTLRTNLMFSSIDHPLTTLVITSAGPDEGKSVTVANLAVTLAQGGTRTILVDADLRRPGQDEIWGLSQEPGLTTMLMENLAEPPVCDVGVENLWVLPSGPLPAAPADLLGSPRMDAVIARLTERADVVLFDAPPVVAVTDAALLATKLDGLLLVLRAGATRRDFAERAKELLERINVRIVGVVLTNAQVDSKMGAYYGA
jgi:capsular exopolysaccharide synthesis family protein